MSAVPAEPTLVIIKPDGLKKSLTGNILTRLSEARLEIIGAKIVEVPRALAEQHYDALRHEPFFDELIDYIQGKLHMCKRVMAMVYWGPQAIRKVRELAGATNPEEAEPTSIRGSYGRITTSGMYENVIHASSTAEDAAREIQLWFRPDELAGDLYPTRADRVSESRTVWA